MMRPCMHLAVTMFCLLWTDVCFAQKPHLMLSRPLSRLQMQLILQDCGVVDRESAYLSLESLADNGRSLFESVSVWADDFGYVTYDLERAGLTVESATLKEQIYDLRREYEEAISRIDRRFFDAIRSLPDSDHVRVDLSQYKRVRDRYQLFPMDMPEGRVDLHGIFIEFMDAFQNDFALTIPCLVHLKDSEVVCAQIEDEEQLASQETILANYIRSWVDAAHDQNDARIASILTSVRLMREGEQFALSPLWKQSIERLYQAEDALCTINIQTLYLLQATMQPECAECFKEYVMLRMYPSIPPDILGLKQTVSEWYAMNGDGRTLLPVEIDAALSEYQLVCSRIIDRARTAHSNFQKYFCRHRRTGPEFDNLRKKQVDIYRELIPTAERVVMALIASIDTETQRESCRTWVARNIRTHAWGLPGGQSLRDTWKLLQTESEQVTSPPQIRGQNQPVQGRRDSRPIYR